MTLIMTSLPLAPVNQCLFPFVLFLLGAKWQKFDSSVDGEPQGNWRLNSKSREEVTSSPSPAPVQLAPRLDEFNFQIQTGSWVLPFQQAQRLKLNCLKAFAIKSLKPDSANLKPRAFVRLSYELPPWEICHEITEYDWVYIVQAEYSVKTMQSLFPRNMPWLWWLLFSSRVCSTLLLGVTVMI